MRDCNRSWCTSTAVPPGVIRALRSLPPAFAIPLQLVTVEDLAYAQVAEILEIPIGTVMSRIYRARRLLIRRLAEDDR